MGCKCEGSGCGGNGKFTREAAEEFAAKIKKARKLPEAPDCPDCGMSRYMDDYGYSHDEVALCEEIVRLKEKLGE